MSFRTALDRLAELPVPGVTGYGVDALPESLSRGQLPALLVLPIELKRDGLFRERGGGLEAVSFSGAPRRARYTVTHLLLIGSAAGGLRRDLPRLIALIDAYTAALCADLTLGGALAEPAELRVEPGVFDHGGAPWHGCAFRHNWVLAL